MPADRKHLRLGRVERIDDFVVIRHRSDRLLIHLLDHVTFLQIRNARDWINIRHHHPADAVRQIQLTGKWWR